MGVLQSGGASLPASRFVGYGQSVQRLYIYLRPGSASRAWRGPARGVALAHNVRSDTEVDAIIALAQTAGATVTRPPAETFYGGYAGVFTDLDGHAWDIPHNPAFSLAEDGSLTCLTSTYSSEHLR